MTSSKQRCLKTFDVKNIIISGTNFWNPGDDFVRDGVIRILRKIYQGYRLNFLFYNFNEDFLPQSKFAGISNTLASEDLWMIRDHVHAIVIAGLSAGREIVDLYDWIVANRLTDRVYLIGAGYENSYAANNMLKEPEATIFKSAKIITGRTLKRPHFIDHHQLPYHHIHCPAILAVDQTKSVPKGKTIEKIGFSIQLPHGIGLVNHSVDAAMHNLAATIFKKLASKYEVSVVAHHKTEYFYFLQCLKEPGIQVIFSSFYQDLHEAYSQFDLVISTRLHACLFANGFGIPAITLNNSQRHTHCAEGFPHSVWVDSQERFDEVFDEMKQWDLCRTANEAAEFKESLLRSYLDALSGPLLAGQLQNKDSQLYA
jgi:hypothetical protein